MKSIERGHLTALKRSRQKAMARMLGVTYDKCERTRRNYANARYNFAASQENRGRCVHWSRGGEGLLGVESGPSSASREGPLSRIQPAKPESGPPVYGIC